MILSVHIDGETRATLEEHSRLTGRSVEDLAESAISEAALAARRETRSICPDDHCHRREPCTGWAALNCRYHDRG